MKILQLRFKNINSLAGENSIDFTDPVFTNDGLFAIIGKTGAGKSTILDAVSLALYGKTPRVAITGSENAVMTRGERDCYAEIVFEVAGKTWKSSWKQERARTGTLKPVNRLIADAEGNIIADQVRACDTGIVEILGLQFEQFTKVIMLAQGSFAAFLQADKNDKGELLEQITGTEIYGMISRKVFERTALEREKLDRLSLELGAIKLLAPAEEAELKENIAKLEAETRLLEIGLREAETALKWLVDLAETENQLKAAQQLLPELELRAQAAKEGRDHAENKLTLAKAELEKMGPTLKKARELDIQILEKERLSGPLRAQMAALEKSHAALSATLAQRRKEMENATAALAEKQNWATGNAGYEALVTVYSAIEKEHEGLMASQAELRAKEAEAGKLQKDRDRKQAEAANAGTALEESEKRLAEKSASLETLRQALEKEMGGKTLHELNKEKNSITDFGTRLKSLIDIEKRAGKNQAEIDELTATMERLDGQCHGLAGTLATDKQRIAELESMIGTLEENIRLARTIASLDEHREHLADGQHCPLCGSLEHPFALGNIPRPEEKEAELAAFKKQMQESRARAEKCEMELVRFRTEKASAAKNLEKAGADLSTEKENRDNALSELRTMVPGFSMPEGANKLEILNETLVAKRTALTTLNKTIEQAAKLERQIEEMRNEEIPALQNERQRATERKNESEIGWRLAEQSLGAQQALLTAARSKQEQASLAFKEQLDRYSVQDLASLKKCLDDWNENKRQTETLLARIQDLRRLLELNQQELRANAGSMAEKQAEMQALETVKQALAQARAALLPGQTVEATESKLGKAIAEAEAENKAAESRWNLAVVELEKTKALIAGKQTEMANAKARDLTAKNADELGAEIAEKKSMAYDRSLRIGGIQQALRAHEENLRSSEKKLKQKEALHAECNKWGKLNELIGSSDGKKFRNYAQALTFEHLLALANRQLQKMSDRYLLKRTGDNANPFELSVIDKFQNGEERTVQNLSGGEKFIVSLSLALGLSGMAGRNMRIDTMFIDEGFGTLDADYLDVALTALSNLQNEGKVIGVISHIAELKERIATHIEVLPSGNGRSRIQITS